jgi:hypothetical protein
VPVRVGRTDKEEKFEKYERRGMRRREEKFEKYERRRTRREDASPNHISCQKCLVAHLTHLIFLSEAMKRIQ